MLRLSPGVLEEGPDLHLERHRHVVSTVPLQRNEMWRNNKYEMLRLIAELNGTLRTAPLLLDPSQRSTKPFRDRLKIASEKHEYAPCDLILDLPQWLLILWPSIDCRKSLLHKLIGRLNSKRRSIYIRMIFELVCDERE